MFTQFWIWSSVVQWSLGLVCYTPLLKFRIPRDDLKKIIIMEFSIKGLQRNGLKMRGVVMGGGDGLLLNAFYAFLSVLRVWVEFFSLMEINFQLIKWINAIYKLNTILVAPGALAHRLINVVVLAMISRAHKIPSGSQFQLPPCSWMSKLQTWSTLVLIIYSSKIHET